MRPPESFDPCRGSSSTSSGRVGEALGACTAVQLVAAAVILYQGLARLNTELVQGEATGSRRVTLDIDSSVRCTAPKSSPRTMATSSPSAIIRSLSSTRRVTASRPNSGPATSTVADGWDEVLLPIIDRGRPLLSARTRHSRCPPLYESLERRGVRYAIRLPANDVLERSIEDLVTRPRGRPSYAPLVRYRSFAYQATSWDRPRRVIAKIEHHLGELFPRVGFIVTTLTGTNRAVIRFYHQRGTAGQWIKEGKAAIHWTRLSCHRFRANEVRLLLEVIAYNLGNLLRRLVLPVTIQSWSLANLQQRLFKTGGRLIRHDRYFVLQLAEGYLTGTLFRQILGRIEQLAWHPT
jgi:hypothetical protein